MTQSLHVGALGLVTDPNPLTAPSGSLSEALNVVIDRQGVIEPRPGFKPVSGIFTDDTWGDFNTSGYTVIAIMPYGGELVAVLKTVFGAADIRLVKVSDGTELVTVSERKYSAIVAPANVVARYHAATVAVPFVPNAVVFRGNLYFPTDAGVIRVEGFTAKPSDRPELENFNPEEYVYAQRAGLRRDRQPEVLHVLSEMVLAGVANLPLLGATGGAAAIRLCRTRRANDLVIRSAPSGQGIVRWSASASDSYAGWRLFENGALNEDFPAAGEAIEMYRSQNFSPTSTDTPTDEMSLIATARWDENYQRDEIPEGGPYGEALYTNETQQTALLENGIPPFCKDLCLFNDMMFFGAATWAPRIALDIRAIGPDDGPAGYDTTVDGLTYIDFTGDVTSGSDTIINGTAAKAYYIRDRMRLPTTHFPAHTLVTDSTLIQPPAPDPDYTQVTASANATATAVGVSIRASDWIKLTWVDSVGTHTHTAYAGTADAGTLGTDTTSTFDCAAQTYGGAAATHLARRLTEATGGDIVVTALGDGSTETWTFLFEGYEADLESITIEVSNDRAVIGFQEGQFAKTIERDGDVSVVAWSKKGEPEHVPPLYQTSIGQHGKAVERIVPTRDSIFVFKEDGVWRISGYSPDTIRVDEYDRTIRLVHPLAACEWNGGVVAWTTRGVLMITDGGVQDIGAPIASTLRERAADIAMNRDDPGSFSGFGGIFMTPWTAKNRILLGIPSAAADEHAGYIYVWNASTGTWTRWQHNEEISCAATDGDKLYFGTESGATQLPRILEESTDGSDGATYSNAITAVSGNTLTMTYTNGDVEVGYLLTQGANTAVVTGTSGADRTVNDATGFAAGAVTVTPMPVRSIGWVAEDGGNPGVEHIWITADLMFGDSAEVRQIDWTFSTDRYPVDVTNSQTLEATTGNPPSKVQKRFPRNARRGSRVLIDCDIYSTRDEWAIEGLSLQHADLPPRSRRGVLT